MIKIVNWVLTRKCNLNCDYCAIVKNYSNKPSQYPDMKHYHKNEMSTEYVIRSLDTIKQHNPDAFHIFYGGEPLLRKDLPEIVAHCNDNDIPYTIISNSSPEFKQSVKEMINHGGIMGYSTSVDPVFALDDVDGDRKIKSLNGLETLIEYEDLIPDLVAEVTISNDTIDNLYSIVAVLASRGIMISLTFIDIAKNSYYDFSNVYDKDQLVSWNDTLKYELNILMSVYKNSIHMADTIVPMFKDILPSNMDCEIEKNLHNITIDADGSIRLCLRIRGVDTPDNITVDNLFDNEYKVTEIAMDCITNDKEAYCELCNHTCHLMSKVDDTEGILHSEKRL